MSTTMYQFGDLLYEPNTGKLYCAETHQYRTKLANSERLALNLLLRKDGDLVSYDEIAAGKPVETGSINRRITRLRKKLPENSIEIANIKNEGYRLLTIHPVDVDLLNTTTKSKLIFSVPQLATGFVMLSCVLLALFVFFTREEPFEVVGVTKMTTLDGSEKYGMVSSDGSMMVFRHEGHLIFKNLLTNETQSFAEGYTFAQPASFSMDDKKFLYHVTTTIGKCQFFELDVSDRTIAEIPENPLFLCNDGNKSINAAYSESGDDIYFTDTDPEYKKHRVFKFTRQNNEIVPTYSMDNTKIGVYRVYWYDGALILLTSDNLNSSKTYKLNLETGETSLLFQSDELLETLALDHEKQVIYFIGPAKTINRYSIDTGVLDAIGLDVALNSDIFFSAKDKFLIASEPSKRQAQIKHVTNPFQSKSSQVIAEVKSSGDDIMPVACNDYLYFVSSRTGEYSLWERINNVDKKIIDLRGTEKPNTFAVSSDCADIAIVNVDGVVSFINKDSATEYRPDNFPTEIIEIAFFNTQKKLLISTLSRGFFQYDFATNKIEQVPSLPFATAFLISKDDQQIYLSSYKSNRLRVFSADYKEQKSFTFPAIYMNYQWFLEDETIYFLDKESGSNLLNQYNIIDGTISPTNILGVDNYSEITRGNSGIWISNFKKRQKDLYKIQLK